MIDLHFAKEHGWSLQKISETNHLLDKSCEEFQAHLNPKPAWRGPTKHNSLSDWDMFPPATLDNSTFHSAPSSASQVIGETFGPQIYGMLLRAITNVPQGVFTAYLEWDANFQSPGFGVRMQAPLGNLTTEFDGYLFPAVIQNTLGISQLFSYVGGTVLFHTEGTCPDLAPGRFWQFQIIWWSDPTLGFIFRPNYNNGSGFVTFSQDFVDSNDSFAKSSTNRVCLLLADNPTSSGGSNGDSNHWWDDFVLYTP